MQDRRVCSWGDTRLRTLLFSSLVLGVLPSVQSKSVRRLVQYLLLWVGDKWETAPGRSPHPAFPGTCVGGYSGGPERPEVGSHLEEDAASTWGQPGRPLSEEPPPRPAAPGPWPGGAAYSVLCQPGPAGSAAFPALRTGAACPHLCPVQSFRGNFGPTDPRACFPARGLQPSCEPRRRGRPLPVRERPARPFTPPLTEQAWPSYEVKTSHRASPSCSLCVWKGAGSRDERARLLFVL